MARDQRSFMERQHSLPLRKETIMRRNVIILLVMVLLILGHSASFAQTPASEPFPQRQVTLANGVKGENVKFDSGNPPTYASIVAGEVPPPLAVDAKLFLPPGQAPFPAVIIVPGSGGVLPAYFDTANTLTSAGIAAFIVDPFAARGIIDTRSDQSQLTWAASTYDVFAALKFLMTRHGIIPTKIGANGSSRGGTAVLQAAMRPLAKGALGAGKRLAAVLPAYPWCGMQFREPDTGKTPIRFLMGDKDNWVSVVQCQAYEQAIEFRNPNCSIRLFPGAAHGFDGGAPLTEIPNAVKALLAPISYMNNEGIFFDYRSGRYDPVYNDAAMVKHGIDSGFLERGVKVGSRPGEPEAFRQDMVDFFVHTLKD